MSTLDVGPLTGRPAVPEQEVPVPTAAEVLRECRQLTDPALRAAVDTLAEPMRLVCGYHFGWREADGSVVAGGNGGKAVRPALAVLGAAAVGGSPGDGVPAAVAVELVHNFSLLHDDVMDRDETRRHRATAWTVFGTGPAILAGDALITLAMDVLARSGHPRSARAVRMVSGVVQDLVDGQVADLDFERRDDVTLDECLRMAEGKTGALLGGSCALGGLFGGGSPTQIAALDRFGRDVGLAFQLVDDLLGIWGDPEVTGKPVRNDLRARKKSLPVVVALTSGTRAGQELAQLYRSPALTDTDLERAAGLVEEAGGRTWCRQRAEVLLDGALGRLPGDAPAAVVARLRALARLLGSRTS